MSLLSFGQPSSMSTQSPVGLEFGPDLESQALACLWPISHPQEPQFPLTYKGNENTPPGLCKYEELSIKTTLTFCPYNIHEL